MASNIIASQEPKGVTVNYSMPLVREKRTYQANDGMRTAKVEQATTVNYRKYFIGVIIAFCLSLISDALAAYLYIHLDHDKHPNVGPIFLVWLVVSCGITYTLALLAFFVYHNLPKNPKTADLEQSRPLQDLRRAGSKKGTYGADHALPVLTTIQGACTANPTVAARHFHSLILSSVVA